MSQKSKVIEMHDGGKDYDQIEAETGAKRSYIRNIISGHKKSSISGSENNESENEADNEQGNNMDFKDDLSGAHHEADHKGKDNKSGKEYHNEWVKAKALECACGCTLNRKSTFCPNCGITLDWSGF